MDQDNRTLKPKPAAGSRAQTPEAVDQFFNQLQSDMRRPDVSQDAVAAAFQAIQNIAFEADTESADDLGASARASGKVADICVSCGARNSLDNRFCCACGVPLREPGQAPQPGSTSEPRVAAESQGSQHYYHHHYHHHYFTGGAGAAVPPGIASEGQAGTPGRDAGRLRASTTGASLSKAEMAVRRMTQDWAQACNTKQLDDLVDLYATDAVLLRSNVPPVRGTAAVREFLFASLDSGLGEVEFDSLRVEVLGEVAFEAGRCKMLVPVAMGKRREERGKYLIILVRQVNGNWKIVADCWSSDLSLIQAAELGPSTPAQPPPRPVRK